VEGADTWQPQERGSSYQVQETGSGYLGQSWLWQKGFLALLH
jgi:hypothetical protein